MSDPYDVSEARAKKRKSEELADRLATFASETIELIDEHPTTNESSHIHDQLLRAATAPGAHYAEARSAQSPEAFTHKISLAAQECKEALHWLQVIEQSAPKSQSVQTLIAEADELCSILHRSHQTARSNL